MKSAPSVVRETAAAGRCLDEIWTVKTWTTVMAGRQVDWIILQKG